MRNLYISQYFIDKLMNCRSISRLRFKNLIVYNLIKFLSRILSCRKPYPKSMIQLFPQLLMETYYRQYGGGIWYRKCHFLFVAVSVCVSSQCRLTHRSNSGITAVMFRHIEMLSALFFLLLLYHNVNTKLCPPGMYDFTVIIQILNG